jgi:protoporphyrinogen oxidase
VTDFQWVYLLDNHFAFNRLTEQKNMSPDMLPENKTALSLEICCNENDALWKTDDDSLCEMAQKELARLNLLNGAKTSDCFVMRLKNAYPIYDLDFDKKVGSVISGLSSTTNLISVGRNGLFLNNDIHDSMEMGLMAADLLLSDNWSSQEWYGQMQEYIQRKIEG